jgi:hypothetical protein
MASNFPAYLAEGVDDTHVAEYPPASDAHVVPGSLWFYDTSGNDANICGADPDLIAGISEVNSDLAEHITPDGKVPLRVITGPRALLALSSATTPAQSHVGDQYGITKAANGNWQLATAKTGGDARVLVHRVDITNGIFFCSVLNDQLQFATVA